MSDKINHVTKDEASGPLLHATGLAHYFASLDNVLIAYLFGSHARRQANPLSDVDIAVLFGDGLTDEACFDARLKIIGGLMNILQTNDVDVVVLNQAPLALQYRVVKEGLLLYCCNREAMIMFTANVVSKYLDFLPIIQRHEQAILERARRGELLDGYNPHRGTLERYRQLRERLKTVTESIP